MADQYNAGPPWIVVIIVMVLFFPVGLALLFYKLYLMWPRWQKGIDAVAELHERRRRQAAANAGAAPGAPAPAAAYAGAAPGPAPAAAYAPANGGAPPPAAPVAPARPTPSHRPGRPEPKRLPHALKKTGAVSVLGWLLFFVGLLFARDCFYGITDHLFFAVIFLGAGVFRIWAVLARSRRVKRYRYYWELIAEQGVSDLDEIGVALERDKYKVMDDLRQMLLAGYLPGFTIDKEQQSIRPFQPAAEAGQPNAGAAARPAAAAASGQKWDGQPHQSVICQNCGAANQIIGPSGECEYCGSPLAPRNT
ncbi:MAG: hypothetical protein LBK98_10960 [Peptococcaceae bacterium]|jgi:hypothetical protein|nr:hypothetical protein [Peptococcaceae bacterium]